MTTTYAYNHRLNMPVKYKDYIIGDKQLIFSYNPIYLNSEYPWVINANIRIMNYGFNIDDIVVGTDFGPLDKRNSMVAQEWPQIYQAIREQLRNNRLETF